MYGRKIGGFSSDMEDELMSAPASFAAEGD
jgi:hypothetical protein